ncbi:MAG TPA: hypothetical protein VHO72_06245 [Bacteroidales bacterium]|nr:hypothetical protein [Bacteroidales bacterium]
MRKSVIKNRRATVVTSSKANAYPAYRPYSEEEDIYRQGQKEDIEPGNVAELKNPKRKISVTRKKSVARYNEDDILDEYLDIPGSELDDDQEDIGSEDEENNYYSIGGDDHDNMEEDRDDY